MTWGVALLCGLMLANGYLSFRNLQWVRANMLRADDARQAMMALDGVMSLTLDLETAARGYAITGVPKYLQPYEAASEALTKSLERAQVCLTRTGNANDGLELKSQVRKRYELARQLVDARRNKSLGAAQAFVESGVGRRQMDVVRNAIDKIRELEATNLQHWTRRSDTSYRTALISLLNATAGGIVLVGAIYYLIRRENLQRLESQRQLNASEARFRRLADSNVVGVLFAHYDGRIVEANDAFLAMLGHTRDGPPLTELNWIHLTPPEFAHLDRRAVAELKAKGVCAPFEKEFVRKDGTRIPCLIGCAALESPADTAICYAIDLSERNRAAETIRQLNRNLEERVHELETLLELMPIGIAIAKDAQCREITANAACAEMLGLAPGANASYFAQDDPQRGYRVLQDGVELTADTLPIQRCVASGHPVLGEEIELIRHDGVSFRLLQYAAPLFDGRNEVRGGVAVFINITERVRLAQELREHASVLEDQQLWLQSLLNLLPVPLLLIEQPSGSARFANRSAKNAGDSLLMVSADPAHDPSAVPCTDAAGLRISSDRMPLARIARGDRLDHYELTWRSADGPKSILINADSLPAMHSHPAMAVMVFQDITQLKVIETELRRTNRAKDALLAMLGHELRNPLAAITGAAEIVATHSSDEPPYRTALEILKRHVDHLTQLVDDMLDLTRLTTGRIRLRSKLLDLREPITHAVQAAQSLISARRHALHVDLPDSPVWLMADPSRLEQIFSNLLVNAAKYTDPGGRIELRLETVDRQASISVRDNGIGMVAEKIPRLFDLFAQVDPALDRSQTGLGIGLTVVKSLVELHNGEVAAVSEGLGKGSEFVVRLPLADEEGAPPVAATPPPDTTTRPLNILLVEDNSDIAHVLVALIRRCGHHPLWADSGPAALEKVKSFVPDLGLLDIGLPGMSGYELAAELRAQETLINVPLVALTGFGQDEDRNRSLAAGFARHLVKPISIDTLKQVFRDLCG